MRYCLCLLLYLWGNALEAQAQFYIRSISDFDLSQWEILDSLGEPAGTLRSRAMRGDKLDGWDVDWFGHHAFIRKTGIGDKPDWLMSLNGNQYSARQVWPGQLDRWRITDNTMSYHLVRRLESKGMDWRLENAESRSLVSIYNEFENDFRDWIIEYDPETIETEWLVFSIFLVIRNIP